MNALILGIAQGLGVGRIPFAPGTFGSLLGMLWLLGLLATGNPWLYLAALIVSFGLSVWVCGRAERILQRTDPSSVVLDEIVAVPLCFAGWVGLEFHRSGHLLTPGQLFEAGTWPWTLGILAAFRCFDIVKPWPVSQSQKLPGGWGVTGDDLLAAIYVNAIALTAFAWVSAP